MDDGGIAANGPAADAAGRKGRTAAVRRGGRSKERKARPAELHRLHLAVSLECVQRLDTHCAITRENKNELAERLLLDFLRGRGKGKEAFHAEAPSSQPADAGIAAEGPAAHVAVKFAVPPEARAWIDAKRGGRPAIASQGDRPDTTEDRRSLRTG